ncbi:MAG: DUF4331 domain-containing protein [Kofleriaceae bacterium]|jgi:hypothetical protein|nr:DUF4331 domain-containing protein [Kofleriaceae bacterium]MBP9170805.1 DUF4331 domain-containing protein [Kofleriaceae bacterium]MBP9857680.1 DUF4331 domain-containing protein [Kofleriaceae bacterium]
MHPKLVGGALLIAAATLPAPIYASSHREAPFITENPKVDATDFYMFSSYEAGRAGYVTLIANYLPLQAAYGGPNYFTLDPDALYEIHVDNNGDAVEDLTFQFDFSLALASGGAGLRLPVGPSANQRMVAVPFTNIGAVTAADRTAQNVLESYTVTLVRGDRRTGTATPIANATGGATTFAKPLDNIGTKSIANYAAYANAHIYDVTIPGCTPPAGTSPRVFVGQRAEGFAVNLGQIFDLVNLDLDAATPQANPIGAQDQNANTIAGASVTTLAIEVPASCLNDAADTKIGAWTTASLRQARVLNPAAGFANPTREGGAWTQVSRLGMPLVNEVVIGLPDKDKFNGSEPSGDGQFIDYVTHPTLPEVLEILFGGVGVVAPNNFPRTDLVTAFLTGIPGVNDTATPSEMLRLNTGVPATAAAAQNSLGAALCVDRTATGAVVDLTNTGCDPAGFPNGRRPGDDVTDLALRVAMGYLAPTGDSPAGALPFVDGAFLAPTSFAVTFPYLNTPRPGAP